MKKFIVVLCDPKQMAVIVEADRAVVTNGPVRGLKFTSGFFNREVAAFQFNTWDWFKEFKEGDDMFRFPDTPNR